MIPLLSILALSQNAQEHCKVYFIYDDIPSFPRVNLIEENREKFFEYLDTIGIEHTQIGGYYFFRKKQQ